MKQTAKQFFKQYFPSLCECISSIRFFRLCRKRFSAFQLEFLSTVYGSNELTVLTGPFAGLKYYNRTVWGPITPKWLGTYEQELHEPVEKIACGNYELIIDVGAAEGYYAVGFAYRCPESRIVSFDISPVARHRQRQLASLNGIRNLAIKNRCSHADLQSMTTVKSVVICDIEGYELELLDPIHAPNLLRCDMLVELHGFMALNPREICDRMMQRFSGSHVITEYLSQPRYAENLKKTLPQLAGLDNDQLLFAMNEGRGSQQSWLWMEVKR